MLRQIFQFENISAVARRGLQDIHIARNGKVLFWFEWHALDHQMLCFREVQSDPWVSELILQHYFGLKEKKRKIVRKTNVLEIIY